MKKLLLSLFVAGAFLSCKDNPVSRKVKETRETVSNTTNAVKEMTRVQDDLKDLSALTPLTNEELKSWLPDKINGMKRISFKAGEASMMNISSIDATYANEDKSKKFSINIIDGAGETGAMATMGMRMALSQDFEEEDEDKYRKTITRKGQKLIEEYNSATNRTNIKMMGSRRFYLEAKAENMDVEETWKAIDNLDLNKLG